MVTQQQYDRLLKKYNNLLKRTKRKDILLKRIRSKLKYYLKKILNEKNNNNDIVSKNKDLENENKLLKDEKKEVKIELQIKHLVSFV